MDPIMSLAAAARAVGVSYHTLRRLVASGAVPHVTVGGVRRIRLSAARAAIVEHP